MNAGGGARGDRLVAAFAGLVAALLAAAVMRRGVAFGPDAWSYWTASVSLLEGRGFVDGHGLPVREWPIGYPLWLAMVQRVAGVSVASVRTADALAIGAFVALATYWGSRRSRDHGGPAWPIAVAAVTAGVAAARGCSSEYLMLVWLFAALCVGTTTRWRLVGCACCLTGAVLTRNAALAFVPGAWFLVAAGTAGRRRATWRWALLAGFVVLMWWGSRWWFDQQGSHVLFASRQSPWSVVVHMLRAIDRGLGVLPLGLGWFCGCWLVVGPAGARLRGRVAQWLQLPVERLRSPGAAGFVFTSLAALFGMFVVARIADPPGPRFVRFASLVTALLLAGLLGQSPRPRLRWLLLALLLMPPAVPALRDVLIGRDGAATVGEVVGASFLPLDAVPGPAAGERHRRADGMLVVPTPRFDWQRRRLEAAPSGR